MKKVVILVLALLVIYYIGSVGNEKEWGEIRYTHSTTNVRESNSTSSDIVSTLQPNKKVKTVTSNNDWWLVYELNTKNSSKENAIGYVHKSLLHIKPALSKLSQKNPIKAKINIPQLKYTIIEKNDVSYLNTPRMVYRILLDVDDIPSENSMRDLATEIWRKGNNKWAEFTVFIYLPGMNTNSMAYGVGEFRPSGMKFFNINQNSLDDFWQNL